MMLGSAASHVPLFIPNPLEWLGDKAKEGMADGWTAAMISLWSAGMWLLEAVFKILDKFLTPNVADPGLHQLYGVSLWISFLIALLIAFTQIGVAAVRRDGVSLGALLVGVVQYGLVVSCWIAVCGGLIVACGGLTSGLLEVLLDIEDFSGYQPGAGWPEMVSGTVAATALGVCSLFLLIPATLGYVVIMLVREAALLILCATMPIAAAGALGETSKSWMWKSIRWFLACLLTAPLLAVVLGIGVQITRAAFPDGPDKTTVPGPAMTPVEVGSDASQVGMAVVGCVIILIACFSPMALFRLLAFVDPGTGSGAAFRTSMAANGGISGLLLGKGAAAEQGSGAATQTATDGRAASESSAEAETGARFERLTKTAGGVGKALGGTMASLGTIANKGAALGVDVSNQSGMGAQGYYDTTPPPPRRGPSRTGRSPRPTQVRHDHDDTGGEEAHSPGVANHPAPVTGPQHEGGA